MSKNDFSKGLGIGGLGKHAEPEPTPTTEQIDRQTLLGLQFQRCRRCFCSAADGATFTTDHC